MYTHIRMYVYIYVSQRRRRSRAGAGAASAWPAAPGPASGSSTCEWMFVAHLSGLVDAAHDNMFLHCIAPA